MMELFSQILETKIKLFWKECMDCGVIVDVI